MKLMTNLHNSILRVTIRYIARNYAKAHIRYSELQLEWLKVLDFSSGSSYPALLNKQLNEAREVELFWLKLLHKVTTYANTVAND